MFWLPPPTSWAAQPPPLPLVTQVVRCWKIAMPCVGTLVLDGATMLTPAWPPTLIVPGLPPLLTNTIVTPPEVSPGHSVEDIGGIVAGGVGPTCGGAFMTAVEFSVRLEPLLKT